MRAEDHPRQAERLTAIADLQLGNGTHSGKFDGIADLAAYVCQTPVALVTTVDAEAQVFEATCGFDAPGTPLELAICTHAILTDDLLEIPDCTADPRTADNPLVTGEQHVRFYAGAQIRTAQGLPLGTLCVLDRVPRKLDASQRAALLTLADQVMRQLELHAALRQQQVLRQEVDHRVKNSLQNIAALTRMAGRVAKSPETREALALVERRIGVMVALHRALYGLDGTDDTLDAAPYLTSVCELLDGAGPDEVSVAARGLDPVRLSARHAAALGVFVNEFTANAFKYAFPEGQAGNVWITGQVQPDGRYLLTCGDDGIGVEQPDEAPGGDGLGTRIMEACAQQLGGECRIGSSPSGVGFEALLWFRPGADG